MLKSILQQLGLTALPTPRRRNFSVTNRYQVLALTTSIEHQEMMKEPALKRITFLSAQSLQRSDMVFSRLLLLIYLSLSEFPSVQFSILKLSATDIVLVGLSFALTLV